jgi:phospholipid N-methyltransferase
MPFITKYLRGFVRFHLEHLIAGGKGESARIKEYYSLKTVALKNKKLAAELEKACQKKNGVLTFAEYLAIDQFGINGYHSNNKYHGEQETYKRWAEALAKFSIDNKILNIIDFGPGDGSLGIHTLKYGKSIEKNLTWSGIEINESLKTAIKKNFKKEKFTSQLQYLTSTIDELPINQKSAIVFSYSLDNLPPEMLINTTKSRSFPNAILGVTISKNMLKETILTNEQLRKKGISLKNGIFTDNKKQVFDLTAWKISPFQRACIPLSAVTILTSLTKLLSKGSVVLIIDEFNLNPYYAHSKHLNIPKDLTAYYRYFENLKDLYENSGSNLLYFPTYANCYLRVLNSLGYSNINIGFENEMANRLAKNKILTPLRGVCFAITGIKRSAIKFPVVLGAYISPILSA